MPLYFLFSMIPRHRQKPPGELQKSGGHCSVTYLCETPWHTVRLYLGSNEDKIHPVPFTAIALIVLL